MRSRGLALLVLLAPGIATAEPVKLTLEQVIAKAVGSPRARMAQSDTEMAAARVDEADAARLPRLRATAFGTISPEIICNDPQCLSTDPQNFSWNFKGFFGTAQLEVTQPIYTFGKIAHAREAARAGLAAQVALADEAAGDLALDAARAYWGVKVARELGYMLDDGIERIEQALAKLEEDDGEGLSIQDKRRVDVLLAEARVQRADASLGEQQALAGLRALTGERDADVDDVPLDVVTVTLPNAVAADGRPQAVAAKQGAIAFDELAEMEEAKYWPDVVIVATGVIAAAQGADDPPSVFANDPFNRQGVGAVLAMQWVIEPWTQHAKVARARGEAKKAHAQSELAQVGARFDADNALAEAQAAQTKVTAAAAGEQAGKEWLVSVLQGEAVGVVESRDLVDAYLAWFQMRARWAQAVMQYNVAVVRLGRAGGEFHAGGHRP